MTIYTYQAIDASGSQISGEIEADSMETVQDMLLTQDCIPEWVKKKNNRSKISLLGSMAAGTLRIKPGELVLYTKQFKTLLHAGVDILRILDVLAAQAENKGLKVVTSRIAQDIQKGSNLFQAFSAQKQAFSRLYCAMIRAGEESGSLPRVLDRLVYIIEHEEKVRKDIKAAIRYPLIVLGFLGVAFAVLLTFVVPKFVAIFDKTGVALPLPTRICISMHDFFYNWWAYLLAGGIIGGIILVRYVRTARGRLFKDTVLLALPIIGPVFVKSAMSRFSSIFSILQASGVTVLDAMDIFTETVNNAAVEKELSGVRSQMEEGEGISKPLSQARYFTPMVINMVAIGEESGNLDDMLKEIAVHYDTEVEYAVKGLSDALGPVLMVGLAAVIGFFAFAIFLPMWDLTKMV